MPATEERLLSLEDVANRLQVSDQSVRRWIKAGKLTAYKPGLEWRIRPSDLEEFLEARSYPKVQAPLPESAEERRVPELWQPGLAVLYREIAKKGRSVGERLKAGRLEDLTELVEFGAASAVLAKLRGPRDIRGTEPDDLAEAIDEFVAADNDIQAVLSQDLSADLSEGQLQQLADFRRRRETARRALERTA